MSDYEVIGVPADMTEERFVRVLQDARSPALSSAHAVYAYCLKRRVSMAFVLALFQHESGFGKAGTATITHSWGNTRRPAHGGVTPVRLTVEGEARSGVFPVFRDWVDGGIATVARLVDYAPYQGKTSVREIIPTWAPAMDMNDPDVYIRKVLAMVDEWGSKGDTVALQKPTMRAAPSPNCGYNGAAYRPEAVVWHITAGSGASAVNWLASPASGVSANYVIMESGEIVELVNPEAGAQGAAWANGAVQEPDMTNALIAGWMRAGTNPNLRTVSIEHAGETSAGRGGSLTPAQIAATVRLTAWLCQRFGIPPDQDHILGHYQVNLVTRRNCPGFSSAEWAAWVGRIAALVQGGGTVKEEPVAPTKPGGYPASGTAEWFTNARGEAVVVINFGGKAARIEGVALADAGVTVVNEAGERFHRSVTNGAFTDWLKIER